MSYVLNTEADVAAMLARIGVGSIDELFAPIPPDVRLKRPLHIPPAQSEIEQAGHMQALANKNVSASDAVCFLGGGAYDHYIPSVVDAIASRSEFYTAYTPYQAEASQGTLQAVYEYQTLVCQLSGMDVANASLYDAGSAVAEAVLMAIAIRGGPGPVVIAESVHPEYRQTLATYLTNLNCELITVPTPTGVVTPDELARLTPTNAIAVIAQSPNFFGRLEDMTAVGAVAKRVGAVFVAGFDPIAVGVLKKPADYGADIAFAEGQGLGIPLGFGGPYLGLLATRKDFVRKIPGRLVGETVDRNGKRCWVLTLQAREQHIARHRATSNICTNQGLMALRSAVYLTAVGPHGLKETAELCVRKAAYAVGELAKIPGVSVTFPGPCFKEFAVTVPADVPMLLAKLLAAGYHAGLPLGRWYPQFKSSVLIAVTEQRTKAEIDGLVAAVRTALGG